MNKYLLILSFFTIILFGSCSIYEDVYFYENGSIKYQLSFDGSKLLEIPGMEKDLPTDSTLSIIDMIEEDSIVSEIDKSDLENLSPLFISFKSDTVNNKLNILLTGDFKDAESLNKAFSSLNKTNDLKKSNPSEISGMPFGKNSFDALKLYSLYSWNKTTMSRTIDSTANDTSVEEPVDNLNTAIDQLLNEGKIVVRYHFPKKAVKISDPEALITQDGKTVVVEYPIEHFTKPSEKMDILISIE